LEFVTFVPSILACSVRAASAFA